MSRIRSLRKLAPSECPQCNASGTFTVHEDKITCRQCGYVVRNDENKPVAPEKPTTPQPTFNRDLSRYRVSYLITHNGDLPPYVEAAYTTAMDYIKRQQWDDAKKALLRCIDYERGFTDALLWLARLSETPEERKDYLTSLLAEDPTNLEAQRELMVLRGELADSAQIDEFAMPEERLANAAVNVQVRDVRCPNCGAPTLGDEDALGEVSCATCGYREKRSEGRRDRVGMLSQAMLKRRSQEVQWIVGEHYLQCNSCGASRTIPARRISQFCPFCGSRHIIQKDALDSFQKPDGILPFAIKRDIALARVEESLGGLGEKLRGIFNDNTVKRKEIEGVYLPYWCFDAICEVTRTTIDNRSSGSRYQERTITPYSTEKIPEFRTNVLVCAVTSPAPDMTRRLGQFRLDRVIDYTPERIAQHAAELYDVDFDKAAMDVHEIVGREMREKHDIPTGNSEVQVNIFTAIKQMTFQLLLLPVWTVTLFEADGEVRPALVNGQSGRVVLGKAQKPGDNRK